MIDRESRHPGRIKLIPTEYPDIYDTEMADEPIVEGTPIEKATMLDDSTASAYGLSPRNATPNDAFKAAKDVFADKSTTSQTLDAIKKSVNSNTANISANGTAIQESKKEVESLRVSTARTFANAFSKTVSGPVVAVDDVSPVVHQVGCKVESTNLITWEYEDKSKTENGITWTVNPDGSIHAMGKVTGVNRASFTLWSTLRQMHVSAWLSGTPAPSPGSGYKWRTQLYTKMASGDNSYAEDIGRGISVPIGRSYYCRIEIYEAAGDIDLTFRPMLNKGDKAEPYSKGVSDLSMVTVSRCGKNIWDRYAWIKYLKDNGKTDAVADTTWLGHECDTWYSSVTPGDGMPFHLKPKTQYTFTAMASYRKFNDATEWAVPLFYVQYDDGTEVLMNTQLSINEYRPVRLTTAPGKTVVAIHTTTFGFVSVYVYDLQVEEGTEQTAYEPYSSRDYTPSADGTVSGMASLSPDMTILTDNPGVTIEATYNRDSNKVVQSLMDRIAALEAAQTNL